MTNIVKYEVRRKPAAGDVRRMNALLHGLIFALRLDRIGSWSKALEGISPLDLHVLRLISTTPKAILKDVRAALGIRHSTLTSVVNRLEQRGIIRRVIASDDRRSFRLELTAHGRRVEGEHMRADLAIAQTVLQALPTTAQRRQFLDLLQQIVASIDARK